MILLVCASSCTFKKRVHLSGYYIDWVRSARTSPHKNTPNYSVSVYDALSQKPAQEFCLLTSGPGAMYCKEGTTIEFPDNAFVRENGKPVECSKVCIYAWEFYSLSDIIASGLSTTSRERMIVSAGMVYVEATCCGERLKLAPGKEITVTMPTGYADDQMRLFSGKIENGIVDWRARGGAVNTEGSPIRDGREVESADIGEGWYQSDFLMKSSSLGWINCDRFYKVGKKTSLFVKADTCRKTYVALIFKTIKSVLPGCYDEANVAGFTGIPSGEEVTVLAYRVDEKNNSAVVGYQDVTLGKTKKVYLDMRELSLEEFKAFLAQFD